MEPVLKPHSNKIGRSHDPDKDKPEITEPILGPTTARNFGAFKLEPAVKNDFISRLANKQFDPPPVLKAESSTKKASTTPYTHIQKIRKKSDRVESTTQEVESASGVSRRARDDVHVRKNILEMKLGAVKDDVVVTTTKKSKAIYVDLPVFDATPKVKYIPVSQKDSTR